MSANRLVRNVTLIALCIAAILSPAPHVSRFHRPANYAVVFRIDQARKGHPFNATLTTPYQLVPSPHRAISNDNTPPLPTFFIADERKPLLPARYLNHRAVSASPDSLSRFQLPPPLQI